MPLTQDTIAGIIGGVSQQPDKLMFPNQVKRMINMSPDPVQGLCKRKPTEHIAKLMNPLTKHPYVHTIIKEDEKYKVYLTGDTVKVFDLDGIEKQVKIENDEEVDESIISITQADRPAKVKKVTFGKVTAVNKWRALTIDDVTYYYYFTSSGEIGTIYTSHTDTSSTSGQNPIGRSTTVYTKKTKSEYNININYINDVLITEDENEAQTTLYCSHPITADSTLFTNAELTIKAGNVISFDLTENTITRSAIVKIPLTNDAPIISYITTANPLEDLTATTIADYTFITNKTVITAMDDELFTNPYPNAALIFVKQGDYAVDYIIKVDGVQVASKTTHETNIADHKTNAIAETLYDNLVTNLGTTNWYISRLNSTIMLAKKDGTAFEIQTTDSNSDRSLFSFFKETKNITDLPIVAPNDFILKILGEKGDTSDDYYVQFETADGSNFGTGVWKECCSPDIKYKVNGYTMPHILIREADGTFTFKIADWTDRKAGDETTAKTPSIFGNPIQEVFTYKGRLGFVAGDRSLYSDVDDIFSLFRRTVMTSLDTDPIDVGSNSKMVLLKHSLAFNEDLLLFSPTSIFNITSGDVFSNSTVGIELTMEYPCSNLCKPICIGGTALFAHDNGIYSGIYEIYVASTYTKAARSITEQIPCYIPSGLYKMTANVQNNIVCMLNKNDTNKMYVYNYYYTSEQKAQSAWHIWEFSGDVLGAEFVDNYLYISIQYDDGVYLERLDITPVQHEEELDYLVYLDRKVYFKNITDNEITIPYVSETPVQIINESGIPVNYTFNSTTNKATLTSDYDYVIVGFPYNSNFQLGNIYQRQSTETGVKVVEGLLMLKDITLNYLNTGYFRVKTTPHYTTMHTSELDTGVLRMTDEVYGESSSFEFTGVILATISATLGKISVSNGSYLFPVMAKNEDMDIEIINDSYLPSTFTSLVWIGDFNVRGQ